MPVTLDGDLIALSGTCPVQDAEPLLKLLQENPSRSVDMSSCQHLHAALIQVLRCAAPRIVAHPDPLPLRALTLAVLPAAPRT